METLSCHSNQSAWATAKKKTIFLQRLLLETILQRFSFIPHTASEELIFEYFSKNLPLMLPWQPIKFSDLDKIHMNHRGLLKKDFCNEKCKYLQWQQQKLPISTFSHYKSMETISCHSNQSSYPIGTKKYRSNFSEVDVAPAKNDKLTKWKSDKN